MNFKKIVTDKSTPIEPTQISKKSMTTEATLNNWLDIIIIDKRSKIFRLVAQICKMSYYKNFQHAQCQELQI